ncbi:MAG: hypothetical protein COT88_01460 [Candidatus Colwellbacteria bacterium CG10_big_fil_rev_8_21_14_0_10_41_28]|uniref:Penicillin-binding protein 2 n=1 Tax=Candidatus Colwellbacteria bacterium CG10_big_fil_rev_8_21_14_0_10_41_28 TaxID=1974539 RepID=A0A2H0VH89_9BACT|nr:MAG: hypothetical protein COT88_01460 [Candidatus Colwellbacteria bacterium CG10_big_fil_rev_8_21_14_0_10_41_28]
MKKSFKREIHFEEVVADTISAPYLNRVEKPISQNVFYIFFLAFVLLGSIFAIRTTVLAGINGDSYKERANSNINQNIPLIAPRGIITDRNGEPLVENQAVFSVFLNVDQMVLNNERDEVLRATKDILGIESADVLRLIEDTNLEDYSDIIIAREATREHVLEVKGLNLTSLNVEESFKRDYKEEAFSHVVGYVSLASKEDLRDNESIILNEFVGRDGLELTYDNVLRGENGSVTLARNSIGDIDEILKTKDPVVGETLQTTIDADLQRYFYERMGEGLRLLNRKRGLGIAIDPRNGEILSLISYPSFDSNDVSPYLNDKDLPLFNRAVSGVYNPGSTIKPFHATAALNEEIIDPSKEIYSAGYIEIPNPYFPDQPSIFVDWKAHGWVDIYSALAKSSNIYFYAIGGGFEDQEGLGIDRLNKYWRTFGFDKKTGIDLPNESKGFLPNPDEKENRTDIIWRLGDTYNVSIGQGDLSITPLELVAGISALVNDGIGYTPHLHKKTVPEIFINISEMKNKLEIIDKGMQDTIYKPYGTGNLLQNIPMIIGGKTGSAQVFGNTQTNALFVAYAAKDEESKPEILILVLVEDAKEGSLNTVPIVKDVLEWYYDNRIKTDAQE